MRKTILKSIGMLRSDERGVTLVEYGVAIALAVGVGIAALNTLGGEVTGAMTAAGAEMPD